jgi:hypothetical protein
MAAPDKAGWRRWLLIGLLGCCGIGRAAAPVAEGPRLESGVFEGLMLAVDEQGLVTGYYQEDQGEGVTKRCSFFLTGQAGTETIPIVTWRNEVFAGTLQAGDRAVRLQIEQGREHPGCAAVLLPQIASGISLDRVAEARWTTLRRIAAYRSHFHAEPQQAKRLRAFVVRGDVVGVLAERDDWLQVEYLGPKATTRGWLRSVDTARVAPP